MKKIILALGIAVLSLHYIFSQETVCIKGIHQVNYGNPKDEPIIFLHGGPGYNCANFQATTAQKLADQGFFVITYDRRGEGRSTAPGKYTFKETLHDIHTILKCLKIKKAHFIGHSFGGMVGTMFAKQYPDKVKTLVLVGAPVNLQESFKTIINSSKAIYTAKNDAANLMYIDKLEKMDTTTMEYASFCFMHAMQNGFYSPKNRSNEAKKIYEDFLKSPYHQYASKMTTEPPSGFSKNEHYTTINLTTDIQSLVTNGTKVYGLYGKEDGLYSAKQIADLGDLIGASNLKYFDNCSHNVFVDQQEEFFKALKDWCK